MSTPMDVLAADWLLLYFAIIGAAFLVIAIVAVIDGIRLSSVKRRYRPAKDARGDAQWKKKPSTGTSSGFRSSRNS